MLGKTHRRWAPIHAALLVSAVDGLAVLAGQPLFVNPVVGVVLALTAIPTASGKNSPDMDQQWAPGRPRNNYEWRGHRGFTHRVWFASLLTVLLGLLPMAVAYRLGCPPVALPLVLGPITGWWSHLTADMIRGRLPVHFPRRMWGRWRMWQTNIGFGDRFEAAEKSGALGRFFDRIAVPVMALPFVLWAVSAAGQGGFVLRGISLG